MNALVVADASVWISPLISYEDNHLSSRDWIERYRANEGHFTAPSFLLLEVAAALSRRTGLDEETRKTVQDIRTLHQTQIVQIDALFMQLAMNVAVDLKLRAGDAMYVALAHQLNIPLITWDKEQLQRAGKLVTAYAPDTFPV